MRSCCGNHHLYQRLSDGSEVYAAPVEDSAHTIVREETNGTLTIIQDSLVPQLDFQDMSRGDVNSLSETTSRKRPACTPHTVEQPACDEPALSAEEPGLTEEPKPLNKPQASEVPVEVDQRTAKILHYIKQFGVVGWGNG